MVVFIIVQPTSSAQEYRRKLTYAYSTDVHINYQKIGYGNKVVLLLHGFGTSLNTWDDIKNLFPVSQFTLYLIDLKGFGLSSKPDDDKYSIKDQANIAEQFIKDIKTDSLYLIGHSYGGAVALLTQISLLEGKSKTKIRKLILIDCLAYISEMPLFIEFLRIPLLNNLTFILPNKFRAEYILNRVFFNKKLIDDKLVERYSIFFKSDDIENSFISSVKQINPLGYKEITDFYRNIPTECLIIWGKEDRVLLVEDGIRLSKDLPNAKLEIIDQCGHVPQEEMPLITFEKINSFINGL